MSGRVERCKALVLRHIDYGESDRIVSFLTAEFGLQKGFAKAARKSRKRFGAALEPFSQVVVHWGSGRGQLWSLQEVELLNSRSGLRTELERLALASYSVELVELLLEEGEAHQQIYELICAFLDYLSQAGDTACARLLLELRLIYLLGYIPHLLHCSECLKIFADEPVRFDAARGGSLCLQCASGGGIEISLGTIGSLARSLNVGHQQFSGFRFGQRTLDEGGRMLSQVLASVLPRSLKSVKFL
ncbi:DNA replication and repair protein RecO [Malonomonas rubra DSM 5091]|uniref:DNA repair protein RecO n=1 Tax=Malonomonas rubra DSM 5091 TaxID=1122189 RepID=A0A1M6MUI4_MALRU|nr:DNA repair protein RecO [Malonomonas rubra]SHJ87082.1 DNA replication and repair protein RecO [Malonomonas rubra DSM 5091]